MPRILLVAAAVSAALAVGFADGRASQSRTASLRLVQMQPFAVRGTGFHARERTRVTLVAGETRTARVTASAAGAFRVAFGDVVLSRCEGFRVVAVGRAGSRAELKRPPLPECNPE